MKTALVTGANKGIGREVARQLARKGFYVFVGARNRKAGRKAVDEIVKDGGKASFLEIDVSDADSVIAAELEFSKMADHLDVLVNNAGIIVDGDDAILEISDDLLRKTLETNTLGPLRVSARIRALAPEKQSAARDQCLKRRRSIDRRGGWLGAGLLHFQNCAEWCHVPACGGVAEVRGEFSLSRLGTDGHGRRKREPLGGGRCGHDCLACRRGAARAYRQIPARSKRDSMVIRLRQGCGAQSPPSQSMNAGGHRRPKS